MSIFNQKYTFAPMKILKTVPIFSCYLLINLIAHSQPIKIDTKFENLSSYRCVFKKDELKFLLSTDSNNPELLVQKESGETILRKRIAFPPKIDDKTSGAYPYLLSSPDKTQFLLTLSSSYSKHPTNRDQYIYINLTKNIVTTLNLEYDISTSRFYFDKNEPVLWVLKGWKRRNDISIGKINLNSGQTEGSFSTNISNRFYHLPTNLIYLDNFILHWMLDDNGKNPVVQKIDRKTLQPVTIPEIKLKNFEGISYAEEIDEHTVKLYIMHQSGSQDYGYMWNSKSAKVTRFEYLKDTLKSEIKTSSDSKYFSGWEEHPKNTTFLPTGFLGSVKQISEAPQSKDLNTDQTWKFKLWLDDKGFFIADHNMRFYATENYASDMVLTYGDGRKETEIRKAEGYQPDFLKNNIKVTDLIKLAGALWPRISSETYNLMPADYQTAMAFIDLDKQFSARNITEFEILINKSLELNPEELDKIVLLKPSPGYLTKTIAGKYVQWILSTGETELAKSGAEKNKIRADFVSSLSSLNEEDKKYAFNALSVLIKLSSNYHYMSVNDLMQLGDKAMKQKQYETAAEIYAHLTQKDQNNPEWHFKLGDANKALGKQDLALVSFNQSIKQNKLYPAAWYGKFKLALEPYVKGAKVNEAMAKEIIGITDTLIEAVKKYPTIENKNLLTDALLMRGYFQLFLQNPELYNELVAAQNTKGADRLDKFEQVQSKIKETGISELHTGLYYVIAEEYLKKGISTKDSLFTAKSDELLATAIKQGLNLPNMYLLRYKINWEHLRRTENSMKVLNEGLALHPNDSSLLVSKIQLLFAQGRTAYLKGDYASTLLHISQVINLDKNPMPVNYQMMAYAYIKNGNLKDGKKYLEITAQKHDKPEILKAFFPNFDEIVAYVQHPVGEVPEMKDRFDDILKHVNGFNGGLKLFDQKNYTAAKTEFSTCSTFFLEIGHTEFAFKSLKEYGRALYMIKEYKLAQEQYLKAMSIDSTNASLYKLLSIAYQEQKDLKSSEKILKKGLERFPDHPEIAEGWSFHWAENGHLAFDSNEFAVSAACFEKAIEWNPQTGRYYFALALAYKNMGKSAKEVSNLFSKAMQLDPSLKDVYKDYTNMEREELRLIEEAQRFESLTQSLDPCQCGFVQHTTTGGQCVTVVRVQGSLWAINYPCNKNISATDICDLAKAACLLGDMKSKGFYPW